MACGHIIHYFDVAVIRLRPTIPGHPTTPIQPSVQALRRPIRPMRGDDVLGSTAVARVNVLALDLALQCADPIR